MPTGVRNISPGLPGTISENNTTRKVRWTSPHPPPPPPLPFVIGAHWPAKPALRCWSEKKPMHMPTCSGTGRRVSNAPGDAASCLRFQSRVLGRFAAAKPPLPPHLRPELIGGARKLRTACPPRRSTSHIPYMCATTTQRSAARWALHRQPQSHVQKCHHGIAVYAANAYSTVKRFSSLTPT